MRSVNHHKRSVEISDDPPPTPDVCGSTPASKVLIRTNFLMKKPSKTNGIYTDFLVTADTAAHQFISFICFKFRILMAQAITKRSLKINPLISISFYTSSPVPCLWHLKQHKDRWPYQHSLCLHDRVWLTCPFGFVRVRQGALVQTWLQAQRSRSHACDVPSNCGLNRGAKQFASMWPTELSQAGYYVSEWSRARLRSVPIIYVRYPPALHAC